MFITSEIVNVRVGNEWYEAEILDIFGDYAYVYIFHFNNKKNVRLSDIRA